jgi:hypothetical protein
MAARKKASKAIGKKKASSKPSQSVSSAPSQQAELDELRAMKEEAAKELAELKKAREDFKREQDLARINRQMAAGVTPPVVTESLPEEKSELEEERARLERERAEAREERRRRRLEERQQAQRQATQAAPVSNLDEARAKRAKPSAPEKEPVTLPMDELHKYKLATFNRAYQDAVEKLKGPLVQKYNQMVNAELQKIAEIDPELVKLLDSQLPEGYAITQCLTDKGVVVAQYVPDRAGKPLPLPEELAPKEG